MGLFNFVRNAGERLFGGEALDESQIKAHVLAQGLALNPFSVLVEIGGDKVTLVGYARTMEDKEKAIVTAGNIDGVGTVEDRLKIGVPDWLAAKETPAETPPAVEAAPADLLEPSAEEAPSARFYTVQSGDNLSKIAQEMYGKASQYQAIFEANQPMLKHPDKIYPGQTLRIP